MADIALRVAGTVGGAIIGGIIGGPGGAAAGALRGGLIGYQPGGCASPDPAEPGDLELESQAEE